MSPDNQILIETLTKYLSSLEKTSGRLHFHTLELPRAEAWDKVHYEVSCLDPIGEVMRQARPSFADSKASRNLYEDEMQGDSERGEV